MLPKGKQIGHRGVSSHNPRSIGLSDKQNGTRSQFPKDGDRTSVPNFDMIVDTLLDAEKLGIQDNGIAEDRAVYLLLLLLCDPES